MTDVFGHIALWVLVASFGWAAAAKVARSGVWRTALAGYGLAGPIEKIAVAGVPLAEAAVVALLVTARTRAGAALAVALLAAFSLAVLHARWDGDRVPCGCFGVSSQSDFRLVLIRNAALGAAASVVLLSSDEHGLPPLARPSIDELVPALFVGAGIFLAAWTVRQVALSFQGREHP